MSFDNKDIASHDEGSIFLTIKVVSTMETLRRYFKQRECLLIGF
jgi:hypothetical protein